ncbi:helix-turn-helix domain-containing protein [Pelotomaculum terephthalicicum JT]|uniref:helix-turn-helix domain-containing protein n=1 Tax=Pelotomaculum TaxID=191373 RepID=UPI0009D362B2|nr:MULTISPECIES: helix-turn-helix domain-containing protein [Pelotomaculum]MCG9968029.1 helix-turn-helix domain-containing protein [Pelotomaculum terephthalicicum JT]OPX88200.1 MAG: RNA polymerase sigma factor [Pelotomaculum sp. PtaB.Bin117]OPY60929.1 MAG: RNA polymerase sigma factor [Pelotomaculum sp. PtaU1.Bin065]
MKPHSHEEHKRHTFDSFCKKILKHEARDYYDELKRRREQEISLDELSKKELVQLAVMDEYFKEIYSFNVLGHDIAVADERIGEALKALPTDRRDIILLFYFLDMTDREIGELLNLVRRTVAYRRTSTLQELKNSWREKRMNSTHAKTGNNGLLPFPVIAAASNGDINAINAVLKHYERYIAALSIRQLYDENGNPHLCVDPEFRRRLETKLITRILTFRVA